MGAERENEPMTEVKGLEGGGGLQTANQISRLVRFALSVEGKEI